LLDTDLTDAFGRAQAASRRIMVVRASIVDVTSVHEHVALWSSPGAVTSWASDHRPRPA
jgi:hypothetical protein